MSDILQKLKKIDWNSILKREYIDSANHIISFCKDNNIIPKIERGARERFTEVDEIKDPYTGILEGKTEVETDGSISYSNFIGGTDKFYRTFTVSNYSYIMIKYFENEKLHTVVVIPRNYYMRLFLIDRLGL